MRERGPVVESETHLRYILGHPNDHNREIVATVMCPTSRRPPSAGLRGDRETRYMEPVALPDLFVRGWVKKACSALYRRRFRVVHISLWPDVDNGERAISLMRARSPRTESRGR